VRREDAIVRLDDRGRDLGRRVEGERQLRLAAVVDREALEEERAEAGAGTATDGVEEQEALEAGAVVGELADAVEHEVDNLLADRVVATGVVVRGVLLAGDQLLRVVELAVGTRANLVDDGRLEVDEDRAWHVLARARLREEGVEGVVTAADGLVRGHLPIGLDAVLEAVELPACVTDLNAGLAKVDGDDFTLRATSREREDISTAVVRKGAHRAGGRARRRHEAPAWIKGQTGGRGGRGAPFVDG